MTSDSQLGAESRTNLKELWRAALGELQLAMPKANYDTWFKETYVVSEEDDVFCIGVPNAFAREWLDNKYRTQVRSSTEPKPRPGMSPLPQSTPRAPIRSSSAHLIWRWASPMSFR